MRFLTRKLPDISFTLLFFLLGCTICTGAEREDKDLSGRPALLPLIKEQWTDKNHEAVEFHLFSLSKGLLPKGATLQMTLDEVKDRIVRLIESKKKREVRQALPTELRQKADVKINEEYLENDSEEKE